MNRIKEIAKQEGRTLTWLAGKVGMDRRKFDLYIRRDCFVPEQKIVLAHTLGRDVFEVFPERLEIQA